MDYDEADPQAVKRHPERYDRDAIDATATPLLHVHQFFCFYGH
ncbi:hypothetical protein [Streptosporangium saharense]